MPISTTGRNFSSGLRRSCSAEGCGAEEDSSSGSSSSVARLRRRGSRFWTRRGSGPNSLEKFAMASADASSSSLGSYVEPDSA